MRAGKEEGRDIIREGMIILRKTEWRLGEMRVRRLNSLKEETERRKEEGEKTEKQKWRRWIARVQER